MFVEAHGDANLSIPISGFGLEFVQSKVQLPRSLFGFHPKSFFLERACLNNRILECVIRFSDLGLYPRKPVDSAKFNTHGIGTIMDGLGEL